MKTYEYVIDGRFYVRYGTVQAASISAAYQAAKAELADGEVLRGVTELTPEEAALAAVADN